MPWWVAALMALVAFSAILVPLLLNPRVPLTPDQRAGNRWCMHCRPREDCDECR